VEWRDGTLLILDQTGLPGRSERLAATTPTEVAAAIRQLRVRGADAIGIAAAYAMVLAALEPAAEDDPRGHVERWAVALTAVRPTAVHLSRAVRRVLAAIPADAWERRDRRAAAALAAARAIEAEDRAMSGRIARAGAKLLAAATAVVTHCNTGRLATAGDGTALAPIYLLAKRGHGLRVYACETRPLLQGARLTAWELAQAGIDVVQIVDGAAASVLARGMAQAVIVGADRIAGNGDVANKVGTYPLALAARAHGVPFYVAAPASTFDPAAAAGAAIPLEERDPEEVTSFLGRRVAPHGVAAFNPAFDITPADLVTAFVTDRGVIRPPYPGRLPADPPAGSQAG
jgi:methylthioribose-1-phosphate isomerase